MIARATEELFRKAKNGDNEACEELLRRNSGLIYSIVHRYCGRGVEAEDLYQLGCMGFLKAVRGFDVDYGTQFSTYAVPKISGEIRRFLRDDGTVKVSRDLKSKAIQITAARNALRDALGHEPGLGELATGTGMTAEEIAATEIAMQTPQSLQQENDDGLTLESSIGTSNFEETVVQRLQLRQALQALPQKEGSVIALRYFRSYTQQECARILGVSQVQISRLEKRALKRLKQAEDLRE